MAVKKTMKDIKMNKIPKPKNVSKKQSCITFGQAVTNFWHGYFDYSGVASRAEFWFSMLFVVLLFMILFSSGILTGFVLGFATLFVISPVIALWFRRFHDIGISGVWYMILFAISYIVPMIGFYISDDWWIGGGFDWTMPALIIGVIVTCLPSKKSDNKYLK